MKTITPHELVAIAHADPCGAGLPVRRAAMQTNWQAWSDADDAGKAAIVVALVQSGELRLDGEGNAVCRCLPGAWGWEHEPDQAGALAAHPRGAEFLRQHPITSQPRIFPEPFGSYPEPDAAPEPHAPAPALAEPPREPMIFGPAETTRARRARKQSVRRRRIRYGRG